MVCDLQEGRCKQTSEGTTQRWRKSQEESNAGDQFLSSVVSRQKIGDSGKDWYKIVSVGSSSQHTVEWGTLLTTTFAETKEDTGKNDTGQIGDKRGGDCNDAEHDDKSSEPYTSYTSESFI